MTSRIIPLKPETLDHLRHFVHPVIPSALFSFSVSFVPSVRFSKRSGIGKDEHDGLMRLPRRFSAFGTDQ
jgi:hypothetical protein